MFHSSIRSHTERTSDRFYRVLDDSRFNRVLLPDRIQFEKVRFQGVKRGSKAQKSANFQYVFGSLLSVYTAPAVTLKVTAAAVALALGEIGPRVTSQSNPKEDLRL